MAPQPNNDSKDIVIIGGGPAGTSAAIELRRLGFSVTVVERSKYDAAGIGETLPPAIVQPLTRLGVWRAFLDQKPIPSHAIRGAWGGDELHDASHIFNVHGNGWHIDRRGFDHMLARRARATGATVQTGTRCTHVNCRDSGDWDVRLANGRDRHRIRARFLIDASGRNSWLSRKLGATDEVHDQLIGIARWFESGSPTSLDDPFTLIEATEQGWWYSAPVPSGRRIVMLMSDLDLYRASKRRSADFWTDHLQATRHTGARVAGLKPLARPRIYKAHSHQLVDLGPSNWLPVGEALQGLDPLSGQGVLNAFDIAKRAAAAIKLHIDGETGALPEYLAQSTAAFATYLEARRYYYLKETRWNMADFWRRRNQPADNFAPALS